MIFETCTKFHLHDYKDHELRILALASLDDRSAIMKKWGFEVLKSDRFILTYVDRLLAARGEHNICGLDERTLNQP